MTLLNVLITSSAIALGVLVNSASPANALVAQGHGLNARSPHSPNHNGMRRKRSHKNRKRCVQQQPLAPSGSSSTPSVSAASLPAPSDVPVVNVPPVVSQPNPTRTCGNGAKVGLAWGPTMATNYMPHAITPKTCWYYNWSAWAADVAFSGSLKFAPMLWGREHIGDFQGQVINSDTNYGIALGMNEVNEGTQANMGVQEGIDMWNNYLAPLKSKGYTLVSPSTTSAPTGMDWMRGFMNSGQLHAMPDVIAFHWYGTVYQDFENYVNSFANEWPNYPLWITEFACTNFSDGGCDTHDFATRAINFLEGNPHVQAYFPFAFEATMSNVGEASRLMTWGGDLTPLGSQYLY